MRTRRKVTGVSHSFAGSGRHLVENRRMYVYLAPDGCVLTFPRGTISVLPGQSSKNNPAPAYAGALEHGTCIKLYNYRWKKKTRVTNDGRYELERFLHSVPLPIRISETRD